MPGFTPAFFIARIKVKEKPEYNPAFLCPEKVKKMLRVYQGIFVCFK